MTGRPDQSMGGRGGGKGGRPAGPWPKKRNGEARGALALQAERGEMEDFLFFLFSKSIFQTFSNLDLNQISFVNSTHHINKYCSMNASTIFLSLY